MEQPKTEPADQGGGELYCSHEMRSYVSKKEFTSYGIWFALTSHNCRGPEMAWQLHVDMWD